MIVSRSRWNVNCLWLQQIMKWKLKPYQTLFLKHIMLYIIKIGMLYTFLIAILFLLRISKILYISNTFDFFYNWFNILFKNIHTLVICLIPFLWSGTKNRPHLIDSNTYLGHLTYFFDKYQASSESVIIRHLYICFV